MVFQYPCLRKALMTTGLKQVSVFELKHEIKQHFYYTYILIYKYISLIYIFIIWYEELNNIPKANLGVKGSKIKELVQISCQ